MYYVLHVLSGNETRAEALIQHMVPEDLYDGCFHLVRHLNKKIHGTWKDVYDRLLPGYLFLSTENIRPVYAKLREIPLFLHLLGKEELDEKTDFYPLTEEEEQWLKKTIRKYSGEKDGTEENNLSAKSLIPHEKMVIQRDLSDQPLKESKGEVLIEPSQVKIDENGTITVVSGPLVDMQDQIKKINLHKRIAEVEVEFMKARSKMYFGIEIV